MIAVYIGVPIILLIVSIGIINHRHHKQQLNDIKQTLLTYGNLNGNTYTVNHQTYHIHYFRVGHREELTLNSEIVWEINHSGHSRLIRQDHLKDGIEKIVIVYPSIEPIKRYINENEMIFVTPQHHFYHMRVIRATDLDHWLKEITS